MSENNIKKIVALEEERFSIPPRVERNIHHTTSFLGFVGQVVEIFMPRLFDVFISMNGGDREEISKTKGKSGSSPDQGGSPFPSEKP